jgi:hypothetical protein
MWLSRQRRVVEGMMKLTREDRVAKRRSSPGLPRPSRSDRLAVTVAAFLFGQGDDLAIAAIRESIEHNYRVPPDPWRVQ